MTRKQLTPEQHQKIEQLLTKRDEFNKKFWQEQREFEQRRANLQRKPEQP